MSAVEAYADLLKGYIEAYAVWEGALDEERIFPLDGAAALKKWAGTVVTDAKQARASAQVYVIVHCHVYDGEECSCVQHLTDHSPYLSSER